MKFFEKILQKFENLKEITKTFCKKRYDDTPEAPTDHIPPWPNFPLGPNLEISLTVDKLYPTEIIKRRQEKKEKEKEEKTKKGMKMKIFAIFNYVFVYISKYTRITKLRFCTNYDSH